MPYYIYGAGRYSNTLLAIQAGSSAIAPDKWAHAAVTKLWKAWLMYADIWMHGRVDSQTMAWALFRIDIAACGIEQDRVVAQDVHPDFMAALERSLDEMILDAAFELRIPVIETAAAFSWFDASSVHRPYQEAETHRATGGS